MSLNYEGKFPTLREVLERYNGGTPRFVEHNGKIYDTANVADQRRLKEFARLIAAEPRNRIAYTR